MKKKVMGKPMKKAQKGKKVPMYDDDANDRLMADTYAEYMRDKEAAERAKAKPKPLPKPTKTVPKKKMQMGGSAESNTFTIPSRNKISIPKKSATMMKKGGTMKKCKYGCK